MEKVAHSKASLAQGPERRVARASPRIHLEIPEHNALMSLARDFNSFFLNAFRMEACKPFVVDGFRVGLITPEVFEKLKTYPDVFQCNNEKVELAASLCDYDSRSKAIDNVLRDLRSKNAFVTLRGWRNECYEVRVDLDSQSVMKMERAATCLFGIRQYGVDINGYVYHPDRGLCIWLQKRSSTKARWPGKMDNIVGGGLSVGYTVLETAHKEAAEEASIPESLLRNLEPAGTVSIFYESERGLSPNTEYVYDLELPLDFIPVNQDGEVDSFHLYPVADALKVIMSPDFKTTSCPVALDFLLRHGVINNENTTNLNFLKDLLHIPLSVIYQRIGSKDKLAEGATISARP